jgi:hypothetical protein
MNRSTVQTRCQPNAHINLLTGRNWTVNYDDQPTLDKAKSVLGGTLVIKAPATS